MAKKSVIQFHAQPTLILSPFLSFGRRKKREPQKISVMLRRKISSDDAGYHIMAKLRKQKITLQILS